MRTTLRAVSLILLSSHAAYANDPPSGPDQEVWVATGTPSVTLEVASTFSDDTENIDASSVAPTSQPAGGIVLGVSDGAPSGSLVFIPDNANAPDTYLFTFEVCDDHPDDPQCGSASATIVYNDPPTLAGLNAEVAQGGVFIVTAASILTSTDQNLVQGGVDLNSLAVSDAVDGTFGFIAASLGGGICEIISGDFVYTAASDFIGADFCYVKVCEALPAVAPRACGVGTYTFTVTGDCNANNVSGATEYADGLYEACEILVIGPDFIAADGSSVSVNSGLEIYFLPGFLIEVGAMLNAKVCGQSLCETSPSPMPNGCHSCVDTICAIDPTCCNTDFDQVCLDMVDTECGLVCE